MSEEFKRTKGEVEMKKYVESQFEKDWRVDHPGIEHPKFVPAKAGPPYSAYGKFAEKLKWSDDPEEQLEGLTAAKLARENAGAIDPATAEVCCFYEEEDDPYAVIRKNWAMSPRGDVPLYYARAPWTDVWVWFGDLPVAVRDALWAKHQEKLLGDMEDQQNG